MIKRIILLLGVVFTFTPLLYSQPANAIGLQPGQVVTPWSAFALTSPITSQSYSLAWGPVGSPVITWQVSTPSAPTSFTCNLQASADGTTYATIDSATTASIRTVYGSYKFIRFTVSAVSGGTNPTITIATVYSNVANVTISSITGLTSNGTVITSTLPIMLPDGAGTNGAGSLNWSNGAASQPRIWAVNAQNSLYIGLSDSNYVQLSGNTINATAGGQLRLASDTSWSRENTAIWQTGTDTATGVAYTIKGADSTGANITGANLTFRAGAGTSGNATGGQLILGGGVNAGTGERGAVAFEDGGTKPTCAAGIRGSIWYEAGGAGVADTVEFCVKDAANNYAWTAVY